MATTAAILDILLTANATQAQATLAKTEAQLKGTAATSKTTSAAVKKSFAVMGLAAIGAGAALYKVGEDFDDAFDKIRTRTGATGKDLKKLEGSFKSVVKDVPTDFDSAATAVAGLNQRLGLTGRPLTRLTKQVTQLAKVTGTDVQENVESVTRLFGDWSVATEDQRKTLNKLYRASEDTGISVSDLSRSMVQFGSPLRQLGIDFDHAAAMFGEFEQAGVNTQTLMPGLRYAIKAFSGGIAATTEDLKKWGVSMDDPQKALQQIMDMIKDAPNNLKANQIAFEVFGQRAGPDMAAAIREGHFELDKLIKVMNEGSDTISKSERSTRDFSEWVTILKNNLEVALLPVAKKVFKGISDLMRDVTKAFKKDGLAGVVDLLVQKLSDAIPKLARIGGELAGSLVKGMLNAPVLTQLVVGGALFAKLGGAKAFSALGTTIGKKIGLKLPGGIVLGIALALPFLIKDAYELGRKIGEQIRDGIIDFFQGGSVKTLTIDTPRIAFTQGGYDGLTQWLEDQRGLTKREADKLVAMWQDKLAKGLPSPLSQKTVVETAQRGQQITSSTHKTLTGLTSDSASATGKVGHAFDGLGDKSRRMGERVSGNVSSLTTATTGGLQVITDKTVKALKAFGVKTEGFDTAIATAGNAFANVQFHQTGGRISAVPGVGNGDKVPAMLEPGEVVVNKKAVAAMGGASRVNAINSMIPRFASGGQVPGPTAGLHSGILSLVNSLYSKFGGSVTSGLRASDSGSLHSTGQAADYVPANWSGASRAVNAVGAKLLEGIYNPGTFGGSPVSWDSGSHVSSSFWGSEWGNHLDHIHIAIADGVNAALAKGSSKIARVLLKGPDGPLKGMGQAALDKVRAAANKFVGSKTAFSMGAERGSGGAYTGSLNRIFPHWTTVANPGVALSPTQVAGLASKAGLPGSTFEKIAHGESGYHPGIRGDDPGGTHGYGLWQITSGYNDDIIRRFGLDNLANPWVNAQAAKAIYDRQGIGAWYGTQYLKRGGVAKLAKGGGANVGPKPASGVSNSIQAILNTLARLRGETNTLNVERQHRELIDGMNSSPSGSDLSVLERLGQQNVWSAIKLTLNKRKSLIERVLPKLGNDKAAKGLRNQLKVINDPLGGEGSLLWARLGLDALSSTDTSNLPDTSSERLSLLSSLLANANARYAVSQAQYGVFGGMATGGAVINNSLTPSNADVRIYMSAGGEAPTVSINGQSAKAIVKQGGRGLGKRPLGSARGY